MPSSTFPKGWTLENGIIGTDALVDTSVQLSGGVSIKFPSGGSGSAVLCSDWINIPGEFTSLEGVSRFYGAIVTAYASSSAANKDLRVVIEATNAARTATASTTLFSGNVTASTTWETFGDIYPFPVNTRWIRFKIDRPTDTDFDLWIDSAEIKQLTSGMTSSGGGGTFSSSWAIVPIVGTVVGFGKIDTTNNQLDFHNPGVYRIDASVNLTDSYDSGDMFGIRIALLDSAGSVSRYYYGSTLSLPSAYVATTNNLGMTATATYLFKPKNSTGGTVYPCSARVELIQYTNTGSLKTFDTVYFHATRITDR